MHLFTSGASRRAADATRGLLGELAGWLDAVGESWLGLSLPPVERVLSDAAWRRDERHVYCSRCGGSIGPGEATDDGCASCRGRPTAVDCVVRLGRHRDALREWVLLVKYGALWWEMGERLGRELGDAVRDAGIVDPSRALVVPMPMPWARRLHRGIDHAMVVAGGAADRLGARGARILGRTNGPPQVSMAASMRVRRGGRGLYLRRSWARRGARLTGAHVVLVDDVRTTGASVHAAARLLRRLEPDRIVAAVLAVADEPGRGEPLAHGTGPAERVMARAFRESDHEPGEAA